MEVIMNKTAFIFPGQGAQYVGMGKDFYDNFQIARETFETASEVLNLDLKKMCFEGPENQLMLTENTQPAILTVSTAILNVLKKEFDLSCDLTAGLSLGEYTALVNSEIISFEEAVKVVKNRGKFMQNAVPEGKGKMAALIGGNRIDVERLCYDHKQYGIIQPANFNCPGQIVIGGEVAPIEKAVKNASDYNIKRAIELPVSAPFHTEMLKPAAEKLSKELEKITVRTGLYPVISNVTGEVYDGNSNIKDYLVKQVYSSVLWEDSINAMISQGVDTFIEIGPGKSLSGFVKKINRNLNILNVQDLKSLNKSFVKLGVAS
jgi:[acyl-carrier-protein] S-malonyltransferase